MSEEFSETQAGFDDEVTPEQPAPAPSVARVESTGNPAVDAVLATLDGLDQTPASEQVPVFESAHEQLRAALADAGNEPSA